MTEILENALDSLRMGLRHHLNESLENSDKWAILELFHCIELLLKERLHRDHSLLIYKNVDSAIDDDSLTVGLKESLQRLANVGVSLPNDYRVILFDLQKRRNRIEHHRFVPDNSHLYVLGKAIKFIGYFLEEELDTDVAEELGEHLYAEAKELMFDYDQLVAKAEASIESILSKQHPKHGVAYDIGECPECGNMTVLVHPDDPESRECHFCKQTVDVRQCQRCCRYLPEESMIAPDLCHDCFADMTAE